MDSDFKSRVAAGMCGMCGKPSPDSATCKDCRAKQKQVSADRREYRRANGICQQGDHPALPGKALCAYHAAKAAEAQNKRRKERVAAGECESCDGKYGPRLDDSTRCRYCLDQSNEGNKARYREAVEAGKCPKCGKPAVDGVFCDKHKKEDAEQKAAARAGCVEAGICTRCRKNPVVPGGRRCVDCRRRSCEETAARRQEWIDQGLCQSCGQVPKADCSLCQDCIDDRSAVSIENYWRRKKAGSCYFCDKPRVPGQVLCAHHRQVYADYRLQTKLEAMAAYGGPVCVGWDNQGCDETDLALLQVDHIKGGGCKHRRDENVSGGYSFYLWLRKHGYPPGYRILCVKCNLRAHIALKAAAAAATAATRESS